ncbi:extracellular catalytic domain type 1 short-chain-length polyhydroxyalkanoate depolymerase [Thalassotalea castellviae]|uniref:PHB depolymerase family esterase n=1 Tax=Thalassotalea castellviae TaxID=3075612 RepID=A0ABU3A1Q0_9GAMM|nr:PHB depolymerase family esterase [Thalassotalea sp. W431]MDT0603870.1 PHB depolymerase family esterase [Thalassotalea sp. W431]
MNVRKHYYIKQIQSVFAILLSFFCFVQASVAGSWQQNVNIGGFNTVHIYTPDSLSPVGDGKSLLIVLHGCVQPINNYLTAQLESAAESYGMVVAIPDAMNKAGYSCWSYWQGAVSRTSGDYKNLINLANTMSGDATRNIDAQQVYIAGLSSGAAMSAQTACLAPDVFSGVAPSAGPTIGTSSNGAISTCETVSPNTFKSRCEGYAGSAASHLNTQIAVIGHGTADTTVNTCYNQQNANGFAAVYGETQLAGTTNISEGAGHTASESLWTNNRISMLWFDNLDHSWSGGVGASGDYIASTSINFATYLGNFFAQNNQRVNRNKAPVIAGHTAVDNNSQLDISGVATDEDGSVSNIKVDISVIESGNITWLSSINGSVNANDEYNLLSGVFADGLYQVAATATDNEGKPSDIAKVTTRIGPEPPATAPTLSNINVTTAGQCATVSGNVFDENQNLASVGVSFSNGTVTAQLNGNEYLAESCGLSGGNQTATVTATDTTSLSSTDNAQFTIDAGVEGDYNLHINQGHITWGVGYSACYTAFGCSDFVMREYAAGTNQCQWIADGEPSCAGPQQACSIVEPTDSDNDGVADNVDNCPAVANADQADNDNDGIGNVCDSTPNGEPTDSDNDGVADNVDNCPAVANADQADNDNDGIGNVCDSTPNGEPTDSDNDGVADNVDNCPAVANADQADNDNDGIGNVCDSTPNGNFSCNETTSSNYAHVQANRATTNGSYVFAIGSGTNLGLYNVYYTSTLAETSANYFEEGTCP